MLRISYRSPSFGFTLIEALISLGVLSTVAAIDFGAGIDSYTRALARANQNSTLWNVLQARAQAMHGTCSDSCMPFDALSGLVSSPQTIPLGTDSTTKSVVVNEEGQVSLTP